MFAEALSVAVVLALSLACLAALVTRPAFRQAAIVVAIAAALAASWGTSTMFERPLPEVAVTSRPIRDPTDQYLGSSSCRSCHPDHHKTWHDSYFGTRA